MYIKDIHKITLVEADKIATEKEIFFIVGNGKLKHILLSKIEK